MQFKRIIICFLALAAFAAPNARCQVDQLPELLSALQRNDSRIGASIALAKLGEPAVAPLVKSLRSKNADTKLWAAYTLGKLGLHALPAIEKLCKLAEDDDEVIRSTVAISLGEIGAGGTQSPSKKLAINTLLKLLRDESPRVQNDSLKSLNAMKYFEDEHQVLCASLVVPQTREQAKLILSQRPSDFERLAKEYESSKSKFDIWHVLATLNTGKLAQLELAPPSLMEIKSVISDEDRNAGDKEFALRISMSHGKSAYEFLIDCLADESLAQMAVDAFYQSKPDAVPQLVQALNHEESLVRASAAQAIERIGPGAKIAVPGLMGCLDDEDRNVRYRVVRSLHEMGTSAKPAIEKLKNLILNSREQEPTRQWAIKTLIVTLPGTHKEVVQALIEASNEKQNYGVRSLAIQQLKKIDPDAAAAAGIK